MNSVAPPREHSLNPGADDQGTSVYRADASPPNESPREQPPQIHGLRHNLWDLSTDLSGTVISDRYKLSRMLARGGMSVLYKASQLQLGRTVAIKFMMSMGHSGPSASADIARDLHPSDSGVSTRSASAGDSRDISDSDLAFEKRFLLEARATAQLRHPNTVIVHDYGRIPQGPCYIAMEYLHGRSLAAAIGQDGPFTPERALHIALQICASLEEAHSYGIIHRDLKPQNVFLTRVAEDDDYVKVLDFGLVKILGDRRRPPHGSGSAHSAHSFGPSQIESRPAITFEAGYTRSGIIMGTPAYMPPEQVLCRKVDERSDIYSFGALLFHLLAGKPPFGKRGEFATLEAQVHQSVPELRAVNPDCQASPRLEALIRKCLRKHKFRRPGSMRVVRTELLAVSREYSLWRSTPPRRASSPAAALYMPVSAHKRARSQSRRSSRQLAERRSSGQMSREIETVAERKGRTGSNHGRSRSTRRNARRPLWRIYFITLVISAILGATVATLHFSDGPALANKPTAAAPSASAAIVDSLEGEGDSADVADPTVQSAPADPIGINDGKGADGTFATDTQPTPQNGASSTAEPRDPSAAKGPPKKPLWRQSKVRQTRHKPERKQAKNSARDGASNGKRDRDNNRKRNAQPRSNEWESPALRRNPDPWQ